MIARTTRKARALVNLASYRSQALKPIVGALLLMAVGAVTVGPMGFLIANSFNVAPLGEEYSWGLRGWEEVFVSPQTLNALAFSFLLSIRVFIGLAVAFVISWCLIRIRIPLSGFIEFSLWMAWFLPPLSVTLGWVALLDPDYGLFNRLLKGFWFGSRGIVNIYSFFGIMWVHLSLITVPVMTLLLAPALRRMDASFEESARTCGSGPVTILRRIVFPLLAPSIAVVGIASMIRSLEAFEIEQILGIPAGIYVYGTRIYDLVTWEPPLYSQAMALSTVFLAALLLLVVLYQWALGSQHFATMQAKGASFTPYSIGRWGYAISSLLLLAVVVAIYLPLTMVIVGSFMKFFGLFDIDQPFTLEHWISVLQDPTFAKALLNTLVIGLSVGTGGLLVYSILGYVIARKHLPGVGCLNLLIWLPWAIPGILVGLSFIWLFLSFPLLQPLYGGLFILVFGLLLKEMPIGTQILRTAFFQIHYELEEASQVYGASWLTTFRRITLPLATPMLVSVFVLVFMSSIRDVSTPILLATPATIPLSVLMLERSMTGEIEAASVIGVVLSLVAIITALLVRRIGYRGIYT